MFLLLLSAHNNTTDSGFFEQVSFGDKLSLNSSCGEKMSGLEDLVNKIVEDDSSLFAFNSFNHSGYGDLNCTNSAESDR